MASVYDWSTDPNSNTTADAAINWQEGQAPSTVNNSARQMMGRVAEYLGDTTGALAAGGTANAISLTANSAITAYANGQKFTFRATADNTGATTVNINSAGAKVIRKLTEEGDAALEGGEIITGGVYEIVYSSALNSAGGAWQLMSLPEPVPVVRLDYVPVGSGMDFWGTTAPDGYIFAYGQAISRTTYADLFAKLGTAYGVGDGSTTFNVPDKRGRSSFGKDDMGGTSANRLTGQTGGIDGDTLGDTGGAETHTLTEAQMPAHTHGNGTLATASAGSHDHNIALVAAGSGGTSNVGGGTGGATGTGSTASDGAHTHTITGSTASAGSGAAHNILPPGIVCNYIIFAGV